MDLSREQKQQFSEIIEEIGVCLDITETEFNSAVQSYNAVGNWLCADDSLLKSYSPEVKPQGSLITGTTIRPIDPKLDMDLDIVCELKGKEFNWTQEDLKKIVRDQLIKHKKYEDLLDQEKRRCWTLKYRQNSESTKYHMDILPAIIAYGWNETLQKSLSDISNLSNVEDLAIRITDNKLDNYCIETNPDRWYLSNPFGYAKWFMNKASKVEIKGEIKMFSLNEAVKPIPKYQTNKYPLQRAVQILKRHRDMMFSDDEERPISVIITTLAAHAYRGHPDILDTLLDIIDRMGQFIEDKTDWTTGKSYKYIGNPVISSQEENFADKWQENPNKQTKFYKWLEKVKIDINDAASQRGINIQESLSKSFGSREVQSAFNSIGEKKRLLVKQGKGQYDTKLGIFTGATSIIKPHTFYGSED